MATAKSRAGKKSPSEEAEKVLNDFKTHATQQLLTREWGYTVGSIRGHLKALQELSGMEATRRNKARSAWHASWIERLCDEYWKLSDPPA